MGPRSSTLREEKVLGLEIAVNDARAGAPCRSRAPPAAATRPPSPASDERRARLRLEVHALEQLHHEEGRAVELGRDVGVGDADDVLALDAGRGARLALEPLEGLGATAHARQQHLEREVLARARVLDLVDHAHAAATDETNRDVSRSDDGGKIRCGDLLRQAARG